MKTAPFEMNPVCVKRMPIREGKADVVKTALSAALEELMLKKDLADVTINEISERAGLSRTTFYRYFQDKYELSRWRLENTVSDTDSAAVNSDIVAANLQMMVREIGGRRPYYKKLFAYVGQNSLEEFFYSVLQDWAEHLSPRTLGQEDRYFLQYKASGITGVMKRWLNESNPIAMEEISILLLKWAPK